jgi:hypothetical protein
LWIERPTHDEKADIAPEVGVAKEQPTESAEQDVDPLDLLDATDEENDSLALIPS